MFKHILLPTDGSDLSQIAIRKGVQFAKSIGAKVTGLCVISSMKNYLYLTDITEEFKEEMANRQKLEADRNCDFIEKVSKEASIPCETLCEVSDHPHEAIIEVCEKRGCDLIMITSHGRKKAASLLLGSETQKVLTHSRTPVMVLR